MNPKREVPFNVSIDSFSFLSYQFIGKSSDKKVTFLDELRSRSGCMSHDNRFIIKALAVDENA
ncbi:hypothetical protein PCCS19_46150 [Paenibacillus sp. CCS19]|nr:hypothetical protein PCCS19_46150 [Paenibacillus cellulosilyticus]